MLGFNWRGVVLYPILGASAFVWVPLISVYHLDFRQPEGLAWGLSYGLQNQ